jgi:Sortase domain
MMTSVLRKWDTILILLLVFCLQGGSSSAVKAYLDINKVVLDQSFFYKQLIDEGEYNKINITNSIIPAVALINREAKTFLDYKGENLKTIDPVINSTINGPFVYSPQTDKGLLGQVPRLKELVPTPISPEKYNHLYYPKYEINANIVYSQASDFDIIDPGAPCSVKSMNTPIQKLVKEGIVHLYGSPLPGEVRYPEDPGEVYGFDKNGIQQRGPGIGNSYIVGHSSECTQHAYTKIFEPLMQRSEVGEEFYIWDQQGRKLKFRVFDVRQIDDTDTKEAYKRYDDRRVVTLQTSVFITLNNIDRWLTRGELVLEN